MLRENICVYDEGNFIRVSLPMGLTMTGFCFFACFKCVFIWKEKKKKIFHKEKAIMENIESQNKEAKK